MSSGIVETASHNPEQQQQQQPLSRARLVQRLLANTANLPAFLNDLITTQAVVVAGTEAAGFVLENDGTGKISLKAVCHLRPDDSDANTRAAALRAFQEIVGPCVEKGQDGAIEVGPPGESIEPQFCLVTLLRAEGNVVAVSAVITRCRDLERAMQRLQSMQLVAGYFELYTLKRSGEQTRAIAQNHQHVLQLASAVGTADGFVAAAMGLCNELASRTGAVRVALGWLQGKSIKLKAISHTEQFDKKQELSLAIVAAMEECADQDEIVQYDPAGGSTQNVTRDAANLSRMSGGNSILSLPLRNKGQVDGVITLEFSNQRKLPPQAATSLAVAVELLAPQLRDRFDNDRWLITKAGLSARNTWKAAIGPKHWIAKTIVGLAIAFFAFVILYSPMHRVTAPFQFTAVERRQLSAPFEGQLREVHVRQGDSFKKGDVLLEFATFDLEKQLYELQSEELRAAQQARMFLVDPEKTAEYQMALKEQQAIQARIALVQANIDRAKIVAPFDGHVLVGDLHLKRDSTFQLGQPLLEIGQRDTLRVELRVHERDIQNVHENGVGYLATTSLPGQKFPIVVERIVPEGVAVEGRNVFIVYARVDESSDKWPIDPKTGDKLRPTWRPGMQGEARIDVARRPLGWIWTHRLVEFIRLKLWI
jgi:multidrug efflux pump subunit AcrA (membrane-fusion protein)